MTSEPSTSTQFDRNIERFSSHDEIEMYTERATSGLFDEERAAIERYFTDRNGNVLDLGCGVGRTTLPLHERGFDVVGVDVSEEMIAAARQVSPEIEFRVDDATNLNFDASTFDYVLFSHNGIDYIHPESERRRALLEIKRVLKPGGTFVFSTHNSWYRVPALVGDRNFLRTFYFSRENRSRWFAQYKIDLGEANLHTYMSNPLKQRRQLRECGFEPVEIVGKHGTPLKQLEAMLYFVART